MTEGKTPIGVVISYFTLGMVMLFVFPLFISSFGITPDAQEYNSFTNSTINFLNTSVSILGNDLYIVQPSFIRESSISFIEAWSYVPPILALLIIVPATIALIYAFLLIIKDVIPFT